MSDHPTAHDRPVTRVVLAAGVLPVVITAATVLLLLGWRGDLPDPIATHWGARGEADSFTAVSTVVTWLGVGGLVLAALLTLLALRMRDPQAVRMLVVTGVGTLGMVAALVLLTTAEQRGLSDAAQAPLPGWMIPVSLLAGAGGAAAAWWLVPLWRSARDLSGVTIGEPGRPIELSRTERVSWSQTVRSPAVMVAFIGLGVAATLALVVALRSWWLLSITVGLVLAAAALLSIRVRVDERGVSVRGALGWPRQQIALEQIADARVVPVRGFRDFGGFGYRVGLRDPLRGVRAWVLRSGDALVIEQVDGSRDAIVVDDAATAAGVVSALVCR